MAVVEKPRLEDEIPASANFRVHLARSTKPVLRLRRGPVSPQSINVHHCECAITFGRHFDSYCVSVIVDELVGSKQGLPAGLPARSIEPTKRHDPRDGIMRVS